MKENIENKEKRIKMENKDGRIASITLLTCFSGLSKVSLILSEGNKNTVYKNKGMFGVYEYAKEEYNATIEILKKRKFSIIANKGVKN
ncbi:hypothetical protein LCGC14_2077080 [marine sediment metagenome]|uniref:Uncharacterized protein n=1 Tax=marine sediment metagenome TaxID=412755 RepID=A0A0F9EGJ8_9ZZZZ